MFLDLSLSHCIINSGKILLQEVNIVGNRYTCSQTFEEWCISNNRQDILDLWDYDKNDKLPSEVPRGTKTKYWFKCPSGLHESEARRLSMITDKPQHQLQCLQCTGGFGGNTREDFTGKKFGELTALYFDEERSRETKNSYWICKCSCGLEVSVLAPKLKSGQKTICGKNKKHKQNHSKLSECDIFSPLYLQELRQSPDYYLYRQEVMKKDGYQCIVCGSHKNLEVHHIYPFATCPNHRLDFKTGICMCWNHHSVASPISFHKIYGRYDNTPEQLEEYVNNMWQLTGKEGYFDVYDYMEDFESDNVEIDDSMLIDLYE